jgi:glycosyltransferase involved in cell wall biosynthesis
MAVLSSILEFPVGLLLTVWALICRIFPKRHDIGIGPLPLINNVFHKAAMERFGYECETFAYNPFYITQEFDHVVDWSYGPQWSRRWRQLKFAMKFLFRYRCLYLYFNGHVLGLSTRWLWRWEPWLFRLAGVKTVLLAYGVDVQDLRRSPNPLFREAMNADYPQFHRQYDRIAAMVGLWSRHGNHITSGCEWVDYQPHWDTLMLAHFSIDPDRIRRQVAEPLREFEASRNDPDRPLRIVHACNHMAVKGTAALREAVAKLRDEGFAIELVEFFRIDHDKVLAEMARADVVADQFVIGWYAMFTLEALSMGKPVLCYLRQDLLDRYIDAKLIEPDEIPILNTDPRTISQRLRWVCENRQALREIGQAGLEFVRKHHSIESVGRVFDRINRSLGIEPRDPRKQ